MGLRPRKICWQSVWMILSGWAGFSNASLPLGKIDVESLRPTSVQISFDPLALLAVLHNARAASSAARLYNQPNPGIFRWPHTLMIGGALAPFKVLVDHLVSQRKSIHPAIDMCKADVAELDVTTDFAFSRLPTSSGNFWLADILGYSPSGIPQNDLVIVHLDNIMGNLETGVAGNRPSIGFNRFCLEMISITVGVLTIAGFVLSVLGGDMWSTVLFATYFLHWLASIAVSFRSMITTRDMEDRRVRPDETLRHAVYQRPEGGKVVFVGRQDTLETWARTAYGFNRTPGNSTIHWLWMISGSLSAAASVTCMVNMGGWYQLAWLGILSISSLGELLITIIVRRIQNTAIHYGDVCNAIKSNETWSEAIIRSALLVDDRFSLAGLDWIALGRLPDYPVFRNLCALLPVLRQDPGMPMAEVLTALMQGQDERRRPLAERLAREIVQTTAYVQQSGYIAAHSPVATAHNTLARFKAVIGHVSHFQADE